MCSPNESSMSKLFTHTVACNNVFNNNIWISNCWLKTASFSNRNYQPTHYLLLTHWQCLPESTNPPSQISYVYENKQYSQLLIDIGQQGDALLKSLSILQLYHLLLITTKSVNDTNQNNEHVLCTGVTHILICTLFGSVTMMIDNYRW